MDVNVVKVENLIRRKYYNQRGHDVLVNKEDVFFEENGKLDVTYHYLINGTYQSTHDVTLNHLEVQLCLGPVKVCIHQ